MDGSVCPHFTNQIYVHSSKYSHLAKTFYSLHVCDLVEMAECNNNLHLTFVLTLGTKALYSTIWRILNEKNSNRKRLMADIKVRTNPTHSNCNKLFRFEKKNWWHFKYYIFYRFFTFFILIYCFKRSKNFARFTGWVINFIFRGLEFKRSKMHKNWLFIREYWK